MTQWILSASLLIVAVLLIRTLAGDRISARLRYALWGLVLLRLLVPVSIGESVLSVQTVLPETAFPASTPTVQLPSVDVSDSVERPSNTETNQSTHEGDTLVPSETLQTNQTTQTTRPFAPEAQSHELAPSRGVQWQQLLNIVWAAGVLLVGGVFLGSNLHFAVKLRRNRTKVMGERVPVYVTDSVETPCLFGVVPGVYVTPQVLGDETALRHVLAHELTHYRHGDHIWSVLRCVCVTIHWYNPLVWLAAFLSQKDGELACDEGSLLRLGEAQRVDYARTLVNLTCVGYKGMLTAATSMTGSRGDLKQRVLRIVKNPKMPRYALPMVMILAAVIAVTVFTAEPKQELEGTWYGSKYETSGAYPDYKRLVTTEMVFRDGKARLYQHRNGTYYMGRDYTYTAKDGVLRLVNEYYDVDESYSYTWQGDDSILLYGPTGLELGTLTMGEPVESLLIPDDMADIAAIEDLSQDPVWTASEDYVRWMGHAILDIVRHGEIEAVLPHGVPADSETCYGITVSEQGREIRLQFADGVVYKDGTGYRLSNGNKLALCLAEARETMQPEGGFIDEQGLRYYTVGYRTSDTAVILYIPMAHDYNENRFYLPDNGTDWTRAWTLADAKRRDGYVEAYRYTNITAMFNMEIAREDGGWEFVHVYPDGTMEYSDWVDDADGTGHSEEYHILPEDAPELVELLQPYFRLYEESAARGAHQQRIAGTWRLVEGTGHSGVTDLKAVLYSGQRYDAFSNAPACWLSATKDGCILETKFSVYIANDQMHIRWTDGREQVVPCKLDGEWLTLYGEDGTWVLHREAIDEMPAVADLIRLSRADYENSLVHLELTDEKLAELEGLLRQGMVERNNNFIAVDTYYYKVIGLEEAFQTEDLTVTDYGTMHFNGKSYDLTNWTQVQAFFDTLYKRIP